MEMNQYGINIIKHFEGCELKAYKCPAGYITIGYGHLVKKGQPLNITQATAEEYLRLDIEIVSKQVSKLLTAPTTDNQFSALVSFAFNVGTTALSDSTLLRMHNARNTVGAGKQFDRWNKATVKGVLKPLDGLTRRRNVEEALYTDHISDVIKALG